MKKTLTATCLVLLSVGCGTSNFPAAGPNLDAGAAFPHLAGWTDSTNHGAYVLQNGLAACDGCHATDDNGARYGLCASCHADYPHVEGWSSSGHKLSLIERGSTRDCATSCHGEDLHGGQSGRDCSACHGQYPHGSAWRADHSAVAANAATDVPGRQFDVSPGYGTVTGCTDTCHNTEASLGSTCNTCHTSGIHPDGWIDQHGAQVQANGTAPCGTSCHGEDFGGGAIAPACTSCHAYPHNAGWATAANHGAQALAQPSSCTGCHGEAVGFDDNYGLTVPPSPTSAPSCYSCHPAYPHISYTFSGTTYLWNASPPAAHIFTIVRNRKLLTATTPSLSDPALVSSVQARCAFGPDGCHSAGIHTGPPPASLACQVCHH